MIQKTLLLFSFIFLTNHEFHITHTTIFFNDLEKNIEITIKVSIEDLEKYIHIENGKKIDIDDNNEIINTDKIIANYFNKNMKIVTNNSLNKMEWIGKEISNNLHDIYIYFEINNFKVKDNLKSIEVENRIFLSPGINQTNIVLVEIQNKKYNFSFNKDFDRTIINL